MSRSPKNVPTPKPTHQQITSMLAETPALTAMGFITKIMDALPELERHAVVAWVAAKYDTR